MNARTTILAIALVLGAVTNAHAQWKWRDAGGAIHYSDQPPPLSVPAASILRAGAAAPARPGTATAGAPPSDATPLASAAPAQGARPGSGPRTPAAESAQAGDPAKPKDAVMRPPTPIELTEAQREHLAQACTQLRAEVRTLESGMRVARVNARGEQEIMSDEDRAKRAEFVAREISTNCPQG
ncbi:MAG: hypothetical protein KJZ83_16200 [Burkholderiaceae bacterium]|nr:hypothetical protein [Burkholderiaceae bacterium]